MPSRAVAHHPDRRDDHAARHVLLRRSSGAENEARRSDVTTVGARPRIGRRRREAPRDGPQAGVPALPQVRSTSPAGEHDGPACTF
jgi:hypothetical protein